MKYLIFFSALTALAVQAQNFSPSAGGTILTPTNPSGQVVTPVSPSAIGGDVVAPPATTNPSTVGPTTFGSQPVPLGDGNSQTLDQTNTAPTPIPDDTSLIITPSNDPLIQSQEETLNPANTGTLPAPGTDPGTETPDTGTNFQVPFTP